MKRNVKFWTRYTWENMEVNLAIAAILGVLTIFGAEGLDFGRFATVVPYFLCIAAIFGTMLINTGSQTLYVPLLLSMGETRRNVLLGFHYFRALIIAVTLALCALIWLLVPGEVSAIGLRSLPTILCVLIFASSVGSILGTLFVKWKWLGTIVMIVLCGGMGGVIGMTGATAANGGFNYASTVELAAYLVKFPWWLAVAAAAALVLDLVFQGLLLRRREVRL